MTVNKHLFGFFILFVGFLLLSSCSKSQDKKSELPSSKNITVTIDPSQTFQTIDNFGASDAWSFQFLGNWPQDKKNAIADLLFSTDTTSSGEPKGIGLSLWRFNLGAGSEQQGSQSGIADEWRRAPSFLNADGSYNWGNQSGQTWFLKAAKERGVEQFLGFFNSPPVQFTKNGKAFSSDGQCNIDSTKYPAFSKYIADVIKGVQQNSGILFDYISPVNEPQWDWKDGGQEGNPYDNDQIFGLVKEMNQTFKAQNISTQIVIPEAGQIDFLIGDNNKPKRGNQVTAFFNSSSPDYAGNLENVSHHIDAHSYFTTSPYADAVALRKKLRDKIAEAKASYWMSEYCILGDNAGEINGNGRDLGIDPALYVARVIHNDLVNANASAWQWWTAVSAYDYKDGLIYIDKNKTDGQYYPSKILWALGNFSRFIRAGFERISISSPGLSDTDNSLLMSAFRDKENKKMVVVIINSDVKEKKIKLDLKNTNISQFRPYITSESGNLKPGKSVNAKDIFTVPARSVVTLEGFIN
jgi:O-glycosyl hydrolase